VIFVDISEQQLAAIGLSGDSIAQTLRVQNEVVDAGGVDVGERRLRVAPTGEFTSPEDIGDMFVRPTLLDALQQQQQPESASGELLRIRDVATVSQGYLDPPMTLMRFNGQPAIGLALANIAGGNVVHTGRNIEKRMAELLPSIPVGLEMHKVSWQADEVTNAIDSFMISLIQAMAIVLAVLTIAMGWRMGVIIGTGLILTILATFLVYAPGPGDGTEAGSDRGGKVSFDATSGCDRGGGHGFLPDIRIT
jgi:multidrug efflux pump subunit AcrB